MFQGLKKHQLESSHRIRIVNKIFSLKGKKNPDELLGSMGKRNAVRLAFGAFLCVIFCKCWLVVYNRTSAIHKSVSQIRRTVLYHSSGRF